MQGAHTMTAEPLPKARDTKKSASEQGGSPALGRLTTGLFYLLIAAALYDGWRNRDDNYLTAETGLGYALGIVGGSMMLVMLLYPVRKRLRFMRRLGKIRHWFRMHMLFGILGPTLIIYHSNFRLGSLNSSVALFCMLLVAASGLVGRYIYTRIHYSLYGRRATLAALTEENALLRQQFLAAAPCAPLLAARLEAFERLVREPPRGVLHSALRHMTVGLRSRLTYLALCRILRQQLREHQQYAALGRRQARVLYRTACRQAKNHIARIKKVSELGLYERLFALWHVIHLPFFLMMLISSVIHIVAVHMY